MALAAWQGGLTCDLGIVCHSDPTDIVVGSGRNFPCTAGPVAVEKIKDKLDTASKDFHGSSLNLINWKQFGSLQWQLAWSQRMAHLIFHLCIFFHPPPPSQLPS